MVANSESSPSPALTPRSSPRGREPATLPAAVRAQLEAAFAVHPHPDLLACEALGTAVGWSATQVQAWFRQRRWQNRKVALKCPPPLRLPSCDVTSLVPSALPMGQVERPQPVAPITVAPVAATEEEVCTSTPLDLSLRPTRITQAAECSVEIIASSPITILGNLRRQRRLSSVGSSSASSTEPSSPGEVVSAPQGGTPTELMPLSLLWVSDDESYTIPYDSSACDTPNSPPSSLRPPCLGYARSLAGMHGACGRPRSSPMDIYPTTRRPARAPSSPVDSTLISSAARKARTPLWAALCCGLAADSPSPSSSSSSSSDAPTTSDTWTSGSSDLSLPEPRFFTFSPTPASPVYSPWWSPSLVSRSPFNLSTPSVPSTPLSALLARSPLEAPGSASYFSLGLTDYY